MSTHHKDLYRTNIPQPQHVQSIICFMPGSEIEVLTSTALLHAAREIYQEAHIHIICEPECLFLLKNNPFINKVSAIKLNGLKNKIQTTYFLSKLKTDLYIDAFTPSNKHIRTIYNQDQTRKFVHKMIQSKDSIGFSIHKNTKEKKIFSLSLDLTINKNKIPENRTETCLRLLLKPQKLQIAQLLFNNHIELNTKAIEYSVDFFKEKSNFEIGFIFSGIKEVDNWPIEMVKDTLNVIFLKYPSMRVHLLGQKNHEIDAQALYPYFEKQLNNQQLINHIGHTDTSEMVGVIKNLNLLISTYNIGLYIADALNIPLINLMTSAYEINEWKPRQTKLKLLNSIVSCSPCYLEKCNQKVSCMQLISSELLIHAIEDMSSNHYIYKASS